MRCTVLLDAKAKAIGEGLTYDAGDLPVRAGSLVRIPLQKRLVEGMVVDIEEYPRETAFTVRKIAELQHVPPLLSAAHIQTLLWMARYYCCTQRQALSVFLPAERWSALLPEKRTTYALAKDDAAVKGNMQKAVVEYLRKNGPTEEHALRSAVSTSIATLRSLMKHEVIVETAQRGDLQGIPPRMKVNIPSLSAVLEEGARMMLGETRPSLLFAQTKRMEIYAYLVAHTLSEGKQAIMILPEILLTDDVIDRFSSLIERSRIAVVHSGLTPKERRETWKRIRNGEASLIIGSRSALFSPCFALGLVIVDEEQEWTLKSEQTPRYHVRETAETLCRYAHAKLALGSGSPSLEAWSRAKNGMYHLFAPQKDGQAEPQVRIIDLKEVRFGSLYPFSQPLLNALWERVKNGEQSVLFLNRRGYASSMICLHCRKRIVSPETGLPFTVHHTGDGRPFLVDHVSGAQAHAPARCPHCGSPDIIQVGAGTQRLEDILRTRFPKTRILRVDADTLKNPLQMRGVLQRMREGQGDILLGTQAVLKGILLPNVTLAAVLVADIGLSLPSFRAGERVFHVLSHLTSAREHGKPLEVIIQTFHPDAPEIRLSATHDTEKYLEEELSLRTALGYPPAVPLIRLLFREKASERAKAMHARIKAIVDQEHLDVRSSCAPTFFGGGKIWHILLRGKDARAILPHIDLADIAVDVDPMDCL